MLAPKIVQNTPKWTRKPSNAPFWHPKANCLDSNALARQNEVVEQCASGHRRQVAAGTPLMLGKYYQLLVGFSRGTRYHTAIKWKT